MRMTARALDKALLGRDGTVDILGRNLLLFREAVRNHGGYFLMKEIKNAIIYAPDADAKLINAITQVIGLRAAQLMAQFPEPLQLDAAFIEGLFREPLEPFQDGHRPIFILVEDH